MAVLRQDLLRSTFQERQITLLTSLEKTVRDFSEDAPKYGDQYTDRLIDSLDDMFMNLSNSIESIFTTGTSTYFTRVERSIRRVGEQVTDEIEEASEEDRTRRQSEADRYRDYLNDSNDKLIDTVKSVGKSVNNILGTFGISLDRYLTEADAYNELQNTYVRNANTTMAATVSMRDRVLEEVRDLNKATGGVYNELQSYETIVGLVNATGIKNAGFYEEYGRLFLETQKTMNLDLGILAEFSDKFYRKYNFSSLTMEKLTDSIRENTAGTSVREDALMSFMQSLDSDMMSMAMRMGGDVQANYARLADNVESTYTWLHTSGYDPEYLFNLVTGALTGDQDSQVTLGKLGINSTDSRLLDRLLTDPSGLMSELITSMGKLDIATGYGNYGKVMASAYGIDYDTAVTAQYRGLTPESYYEFLNTRPVSEDPAKELYVSAEQRTANLTGEMSVTLADLSRSLGMNLSTIIDILGNTKDIVSSLWGAFGGNFAGSALGTFLSSKFISSFIGSGSTGMSGLLVGGGSSLAGIIGPALGVVGAAVGIAAVVQSIHDGMELNDRIRNAETNTFGIPVGTDLSKPLYLSSLGSLDEYGNMTYGLTSNGISATPGEYGVSKEKMIEQSTGLSYKDNFGELFLKTLVGSGYFGDNTSWYHYIPLLGSVIGSIQYSSAMSAYNSTVPGIYSTNDIINKYLNKNGATLYKALYAILSNEGNNPAEFASPLAQTISKIADQYISKGLVPTSLDSNGLPKTWKSYTETAYAPYIQDYINGNIPMYRMGTNYVNGDQLALVHEGEAIIPAQYNPFSRHDRPGSSGYLGIISHSTSEYSKIAETYLPYLKDISETIFQIREFLKFWRMDAINREAVKSVSDSAKSTNLKLSLVTGGASLGTDSF